MDYTVTAVTAVTTVRQVLIAETPWCVVSRKASRDCGTRSTEA